MDFAHELIIPNDGFPFKLFLFEGKNGHYLREKHWHRSIEIFAVFDGELEFFVENQSTVLKEREFMVVNSNEMHSIYAQKTNRTIVLQIPLKQFDEYYTAENFIRFSHDARTQDQLMMNLLQEMFEWYVNQKEGYRLQVNALFYQILYLLVTKYREKEVSQEQLHVNHRLNKLSRITEYMRDNYTDELSLEGIAEIFGYSPTYLSRMFQKYAKTNYKTYLQSIRVGYAHDELIKTDHSIVEVALNNGFPNGKAFARVFKNTYHMLPSEYRQHIVTGEEVKT